MESKDSDMILRQRQDLPIYKVRDKLVQAVAKNRILIVVGQTGSGKSTQITQYLAESKFHARGEIGCTQPRRIAAMSVAQRVAEEYGCPLGDEVGYTIRFDDCTGPVTFIRYMTEGMLLRDCISNLNLKRYSVIILDEAHERTLNTDVLFGLLKQVSQRRPEFRVIIASATLNASKFSKYFDNAPIFEIDGRTYPVEISHYGGLSTTTNYVEVSVERVLQIHLYEKPGDILLFLTGQEEIETACDMLNNRRTRSSRYCSEFIVLPLYASLPLEIQAKIFEPTPVGCRKCVVATNIAETSLTIDGILYVVDPGYIKEMTYNSKTGMSSLEVKRISKAAAKQRAGRAGRTGPGKAYRLYTEREHERMLSVQIPEIQRTNLTTTVLNLKAMGIIDVINFDFMDAPSKASLEVAVKQLHLLSALDGRGFLTPLGKHMSDFPLDPNLSKMLIKSVELRCSEEILTIVSILSVSEKLFYRPKAEQKIADSKKATFFKAGGGDFLMLLNVYNAWKEYGCDDGWCHRSYINAKSLQSAKEVREQLLNLMNRFDLDIFSAYGDNSRVQKTICSAYFMNVAEKSSNKGYLSGNGGEVFIHPSSSEFSKLPQTVVFHEVVKTSKEFMKGVTPINRFWLYEFK